MAPKFDCPQGPMWAPIPQALVFVAVTGGLVWVCLKVWGAVFFAVGWVAR